MSVQQWLNQLSFDRILELLVVVLASLTCITIHEVSHGYAAFFLGDNTAKRAGRLSLNPVRHISLSGLICMAFLHFGWAKPVPIDPRNFRNFRRDTALVSLAGPLSNVVLSLFAMLLYSSLFYVYYVKEQPEWMYWILYYLNYVYLLSAGLAVFNLIPIPPLDGSKIILPMLPQKIMRFVFRYERYGMIVLMVILYIGLLDRPLMFLRTQLIDFLWIIGKLPFEILKSSLK